MALRLSAGRESRQGQLTLRTNRATKKPSMPPSRWCGRRRRQPSGGEAGGGRAAFAGRRSGRARKSGWRLRKARDLVPRPPRAPASRRSRPAARPASPGRRRRRAGAAWTRGEARRRRRAAAAQSTSGWRRKVPVAVQGASSSTASNWRGSSQALGVGGDGLGGEAGAREVLGHPLQPRRRAVERRRPPRRPRPAAGSCRRARRRGRARSRRASGSAGARGWRRRRPGSTSGPRRSPASRWIRPPRLARAQRAARQRLGLQRRGEGRRRRPDRAA